MTLGRLLLRNVVFHWRGNLAVFLGVAVGATVLTGALFVGDSLRGSLREHSLRQLGWVDQALIANRFFRDGLDREIGGPPSAPVILLQGTVRKAGGPEPAGPRRSVKATVLGVGERFWGATPPVGLWGELRKMAFPFGSDLMKRSMAFRSGRKLFSWRSAT